ncbi:MAG: hypothetical protein R2755_33785 [Acidimicrobiales bacterium]
MLAASVGFNINVVLHLIAEVAAFGPLLVFGRLWATDPEGAAKLYTRISLPALVLLWVFGMGALGLSGSDGVDKYEMSDPWVLVSLLIWVILVAIGVAVIMPASKQRGEDARKRLMAGVGTTHLLLVVAVILMVFRPGS